MAPKRKFSDVEEKASTSRDVNLAILKYLKANGFTKVYTALAKEASLENVDVSSAVDLLAVVESTNGSNGAAAKKAKPAPSSSSSSSSSSSDSESSDSESESEEEKKPVAKAAPAKVTKEESSSDSSDSSDSDSDSSDDESEKPAPKAAPAKAAPVKAAPAKISTKMETSDSDSDSSSSSSSSSSSDSDSDEEEEEKPKPKPKTPAKTVAPAAKTPAKTPAPATPSANGGEQKIYVKGLPWKVTEDEVTEFFQECEGILRAELPMGEDGRSTGTAFVYFSGRAGVDAALALDGQTWPGTERWLKIAEAFEKPDRKSFSGGPTGEKPEGCDTVFVGNLAWDVDEDALRGVFADCGEISSVRFATNEDGSFRGFGHVSFYSGDSVDEAVKLAGTPINGRAIRVDFAPPRQRPAFGSPGSPTGGRGRGRGRESGGRGDGRGRGRGGRGAPSASDAKRSGSAVAGEGKKITFD